MALPGTSQPAPNVRQARVFLFLQGPMTPFFRLIADRLEARGHGVRRINLWFGDWLHWRRPGATDYRGRLSDWQGFIADYLDREGITDILLLGEQRAYHRAAIAEARARGIRVVATDFGYLRPDWITFELDGMSAESRFPRDPDAIRALARQVPPVDLARRFDDDFWHMVRWDMAYHLSGTLLRVLYPFYRSHHVYHPVLVYLGTGLHLLRTRLGARRARRDVAELTGGDAPYFVFPLQMQNDFQIRVYSPYPKLEVAVREVIASFAQHADPSARLAIKEHPLDPSMINWRRTCRRIAREHGIADRVVFIDGGSLDDLLAGSRGVVTVNSTVGIWALLAGRPLLTLGSAVYDVPGLTHQDGLDAFWYRPAAVDLGLRDAFIRAMAGTIQLRGVYYRQPGLDAAVDVAVERLDRELVNAPLPYPLPGAAA
jgi:capsular polysaccharide export protein